MNNNNGKRNYKPVGDGLCSPASPCPTSPDPASLRLLSRVPHACASPSLLGERLTSFPFCLNLFLFFFCLSLQRFTTRRPLSTWCLLFYPRVSWCLHSEHFRCVMGFYTFQFPHFHSFGRIAMPAYLKPTHDRKLARKNNTKHTLGNY